MDAKNTHRASPQQSADSHEPIHFAGKTLAEHPHICAFFHGPDDEYRVMLPFIKEGLERGEKAFHVVDPHLRESHVRHMASFGIDVAAAERNGQLDLCDWHDAYLRDGHFEQQKMLSFLQNVLDDAKREGFPLTRLVAHMEWALEDRPGVDDIVEYESRLNYVLPQYNDAVVCLYDLTKFGGDIVIDVMRTHPLVLIDGVLLENPFYVPPDRFLKQLRERQVGQTAEPRFQR